MDGCGASSLAARRQKLAFSVFGFSIALLALNDSVFKGHPAFPGWLTGKLSDFAGLVVAPLTLIVLTGVKRRRARLLCVLAPALFLTLINLSVECSRAVVDATAMIGLSWRLWPDRADLWSLIVLPLALVLGSWAVRVDGASPLRGRPSWSARGLAVAGGVACLATSSGGPEPATSMHSARAYLVNRTGAELMVEVSELLGEMDCVSGPPIESDLLRDDDFAEGIRYALEPNGVLRLPRPQARNDCGPVRVVVPGLTMGVDWDKRALPRELPPTVGPSELTDTRQLVIIPASGSNQVPTFGLGTRRLGIMSDVDPLPVSDCGQAAVPRLEFSGENGPISGLTLVAVETLSEPCFQVALAADLAAVPERHLYLCMPQTEFPFVLGDVLDGQVADNELTLARQPTASPSIALYRGYWDLNRDGLRFDASDCGQMRDACGAIWQPLDVYGGAGNALDIPLIAGERIAVGDAEQSTYYLLRALSPIVIRAECDPASAYFGTWVEFIRRTE